VKLRISTLADRPDDHLASYAAAHLARLVEGRSARRLAPRISTTSVDANIDVATEIFTRINVTGRPLSVFEVMVAKTFDAARDFDLPMNMTS
jgi:hypothetical protein